MFDWYYSVINGHVGYSKPMLLLCIDTVHSPIYQSNIGTNPKQTLKQYFNLILNPYLPQPIKNRK